MPNRNSSAIDVDAIDVDAVDVSAAAAPDGVIDLDASDAITPAAPPPARPRRSRRDSPSTETLDISQASSALSSDLEAEELADPSVSVVDLFRKYNAKHFWGSLHGTFVEWSTRMTSCAGTCTFRGRAGGCRIALSEPLLKLRPRSDLLSTLLHEMIHAYLFLKMGTTVRDGQDGHGPIFLSHAARINAAERGRVSITPYHTFSDEVALYQVHHWACRRCGRLIKRAMNRAPAPRDAWWPRHAAACGGEFVKVREPEPKKKWKRPKKFHGVAAIDPNDKSAPKPPPGVMRTQRVEEILGRQTKAKMVPCPVCGKRVPEREVNQHLDKCLAAPGMQIRDRAVDRQDRAGPQSGLSRSDARDVGAGPSKGRPTPSAGRRLGDLRDAGGGSSSKITNETDAKGAASSGSRRSGDLRNYFAARSSPAATPTGRSNVGYARSDVAANGTSDAGSSRNSGLGGTQSPILLDSSSGKRRKRDGGFD